MKALLTKSLFLLLPITVLAAPQPQSADSTTTQPSQTAPQTVTEKAPATDLQSTCKTQLSQVPQGSTFKKISDVCEKAKQLSSCTSVKSESILHYDFTAPSSEKSSQNILVFGIVHGDEEESATVALAWLNRLAEISPRNNWRIIPILNPDGWRMKTRTNANGVDVNRNFPSKDWEELALKYWKTKAEGSPRRFPGNQSASEPETRCAMDHITQFKPNFVISIHTPLGLLDFDGPRVPPPNFKPLPWVRLGNFPGSLGRYMWVDRKVPVLTVELKGKLMATQSLEQFDKLQDITGTVAIQAKKATKK